MKKCLILIALLVITITGFSQEKEKRVRPTDIPATIIELVAPYTKEARRVRYYEEYDGKNWSYEVKFILHKNHFSVEFSKDRKLEDVETILCFTELPKSVQNKIVDHLYPNKNFKIKKTQKQYRSESLSDIELIDAAVKNENIAGIRYELIIQVKETDKWSTFEMLYNETGEFISKSEVVARSEDHLLY